MSLRADTYERMRTGRMTWKNPTGREVLIPATEASKDPESNVKKDTGS